MSAGGFEANDVSFLNQSFAKNGNLRHIESLPFEVFHGGSNVVFARVHRDDRVRCLLVSVVIGHQIPSTLGGVGLMAAAVTCRTRADVFTGTYTRHVMIGRRRADRSP